ncbi:MAG: hypothetical protein L6R28_24715 [Planctomycetes bacterium]|nr:hypothetical protein [Planctomycetota bacterium]
MPKKSAQNKKAVKQALYSIAVKVEDYPRVVYFARKNGKSKTPGFEDVTHRVARLEIEPVPGDADGAHVLRRLDAKGALVWQTRHPSLQETFWHAEWEYEVKEEAWSKG